MALEISPTSKLLSAINFEDLLAFLDDTGWQLSTSKNEMWYVFLGVKDLYGDPIEIVLPKTRHIAEQSGYIATAIKSLSAILDIYPEELVTRIKYHDRDVLRIRNPETGDLDSIPLKVASQQVAELKQLVAYSACSEENPKPFFVNTQLALAKRMVEEYRFGHTFRGSFGFTVETPAISRLGFVVQDSFFPQIVDDKEIIPVHRRVMERIVRGLLVTQKATSERNSQLLIDSYQQGFNSNMCRAILNMSMGKKIPLDFSIAWSARKEPSNEDVKNPGVIRIEKDSYEHLEYAADILSELESEEVTIKGLITELKVDDNPLGLDTSRSILVRWIEEPDGRVYKVFVVLDKDDYIKSIHAHQEWIPVSISGNLKRIKNHWRLLDYHDFKILN